MMEKLKPQCTLCEKNSSPLLSCDRWWQCTNRHSSSLRKRVSADLSRSGRFESVLYWYWSDRREQSLSWPYSIMGLLWNLGNQRFLNRSTAVRNRRRYLSSLTRTLPCWLPLCSNWRCSLLSGTSTWSDYSQPWWTLPDWWVKCHSRIWTEYLAESQARLQSWRLW